MTDIERMAREAGFEVDGDWIYANSEIGPTHAMCTKALTRFAELVLAQERERFITALRLAREGYASEAVTGLPVLAQWRDRTLALIDAAIRST